MSPMVETFSPMVIPFCVERDNLPPDILPKIYRRLVSDDILPDLVPESHISEDDFIEFVTGPALLSLFLDVGSGQFAGLAWITKVEEGEKVRKACAAVAFFREHWHPRQTRIFGRIVLGHWFNVYSLDLVYAMTPASNILAQKYAKRVGFQYLPSRIKNFTSRRGEVCDGLIGVIYRDDFNNSPD